MLAEKKLIPYFRRAMKRKDNIQSLLTSGRFVLFLMIPLLMIQESQAQLDLQWVRQYDSYAWDSVNDHIQTSDGGFATTGMSTPENSLVRQMTFIKCNTDGDSLWSKSYRSEVSSVGQVIFETDDGGFLLFGTILTNDTNNFGRGDIFIVRTDEAGDSLYSHQYGTPGRDDVLCAVRARSGNYAIAGTSIPTVNGNEDAFLMMLDENGDSLWAHTYGGRGVDKLNEIIQTSDGGFALVGSTNSRLNGSDSYWVLFVDENGDSLDSFVELYPNGNFGWGETIQQLENGSFIVSGTLFHADFHPNRSLVWTVGLNNRHRRIWQRIDGDREGFHDLAVLSSCLTSDGSVAITGYYRYTPDGPTRFSGYYILKIRPNGEVAYYQLWENEWPMIFTNSIIQTQNGCLSLGGVLQPDNGGSDDLSFLAQTSPDPDWSSVRNKDVPFSPQLSMNVFPNPSNGFFNFDYQLPLQHSAVLNIYNSSGQIVGSLMNMNLPVAGTISWNPAGLPSGTYFAKLKAGDQSSIAPLILVR